MFLRITIITVVAAAMGLAEHELERVREADKVLQEIMNIPEKTEVRRQEAEGRRQKTEDRS